MNKNKIIMLSLLVVSAITSVQAISLVDKIWNNDTSTFTYEWTVRSNNKVTLDTDQTPLVYSGTVGTNGSLMKGGRYHVTVNGTTLTILDNGGVSAGDKVSLLLGNNIALTSTAGGQLRIDSDNGQKLNAATAPLLVNGGATVIGLDIEYVGSTTGYRVTVLKNQ